MCNYNVFLGSYDVWVNHVGRFLLWVLLCCVRLRCVLCCYFYAFLQLSSTLYTLVIKSAIQIELLILLLLLIWIPFLSNNLSNKNLAAGCIDEAAAMMGKTKGFKNRLMVEAPRCAVFHYMPHQQVLFRKRLSVYFSDVDQNLSKESWVTGPTLPASRTLQLGCKDDLAKCPAYLVL